MLKHVNDLHPSAQVHEAWPWGGDTLDTSLFGRDGLVKEKKEMNYSRRLAAMAARVMTDRHARCASGDDSEV